MHTRFLLFALCLGLVGAWGLSAPEASAQDDLRKLQPAAVNATDGVFEDRVKVTWPSLGSDSASYEVQVYRDMTANGAVDGGTEARIGVAASEDSLFNDTGGDPGVVYEYCLVADDGRSEDGPYCDEGRRTLNVPVDVRATDRTETGRVRVQWADRSGVDDGYRIERDGVRLLRTEPGAQEYVDAVQAAGNVAVDYVEMDDAGAFPSFQRDSLTASGVTNNIGPVATPRAEEFGLRLRTRVRVETTGDYAFSLTSGGPGRVRVGGEMVVDTTEESGSVELDAGLHLLAVEYVQRRGEQTLDLRWEGPSFDERALAPERLSLPAEARPEAKAAYFAYYEGDFGAGLPRFDAITPVATGASARVSADPIRRDENAALRYRATLQVPEEAVYTFFVESGGTSRLDIDGQPVVGAHRGAQSGTVELAEGAHSLVVEYAQGAGDPGLTVEWEGGSVERAELPFTTLSLNRVEHEYCVATVDAEGFSSDRRCATGAPGAVQPPGDVQASDGQYDDRVFLSWRDDVRDAGFRVYRRVIGADDSTLIATTRPNAISIADTSAEVGVPYRYCVLAQTPSGLVSRANCDRGIRARLPPPRFLTATDGAHDDRIELTWDDPSPAESAYHVYRRKREAASESFQVADAVHGASFEYVEGTFGQRPEFDDLTPDSVGVADSFSVAPAQRGENFALRYRAALEVTDAGTHTVYLDGNDGGRILVNGAVVAEDGGAGSVTLTEGLHAVTVEHYQGAGAGAALSVEWEGPSVEGRRELGGDSIYPDLGTRISRLPANRDSFTDREVEPGRQYVYHVVGISNQGGVSKANAAVGRRAKVIAPETITAADSTFEDRVRIEWDTKSTRASVHRIYRDGERIKVISDPQQTYIDPKPTANTRHTYCVEAVTDLGAVSKQVCDFGSRYLKAPSGLKASDGTDDENAVQLQWSDNSSVTETVYVHRRKAGQATGGVGYEYVEGGFTELPNFDSATLTATGETSGFTRAPAQRSEDYAIRFRAALDVPETGTYTFHLTSDDGSRLLVDGDEVVDNGGAHGTEEKSETLELEAGVHAITVEYFQAGGGSALSVEWEGPSVQRTVIEGGALVSAPGALLATLPPEVADYTDRAAVPGVDYVYGVYVTGGGPGRSDTTADGGGRIFNAPEDVQATDGRFEDRIDLTWTDASQAETGYVVYRGEVGRTASTLVGTTGRNATTFTDDEGLVVGQEYDYTVVPRDELGEAAPSSDRGRTTIEAPQSVKASVNYESKIVVTWEDASDVESGYEIRREGTVLDTLSANASTYLDAGKKTAEIEYCLRALGGTDGSEEVCDTGATAGNVVRIQDGVDDPEVVRIADLNGDGNDDVLVGRFDDSNIDKNEIAWFENDGQTQFSGKKVITYNPPSLQREREEISVIDIDGDGDLDIVTNVIDTGGDGSQGEDQADEVGWFENQGDGTFGGMQSLDFDDLYPDSDMIEVIDFVSVRFADMDEDGDADIYSVFDDLSGGPSPLAWFENTGGDLTSGGAWTYHEVERFYGSRIQTGAYLHAANIEAGDSQKEIIALLDIQDNVLEWHSTDGGRTEVEINRGRASSFEGERLYPAPIRTADVDQDGDLDVITGGLWNWPSSSGEEDRYISWYENGNADFQEHPMLPTLGTGYNNPLVEIGDVDGDGAPDVLVSSENNDVIRWFENRQTGSGDLYEGQFEQVFLSFDGVGGSPIQSMAAADLGGGEDAEVAVALADDSPPLSEIAVYPEPVGGVGEEGGGQGGPDAPTEVAATDGTNENGVRVTWTDNAQDEDGYRIYRNGKEVGTVGADQERFEDPDARLGSVSEFCVVAYADGRESVLRCDFGYRPPDGALTGRVATLAGGAVSDVDVCLSPSPSRAFQLDGQGGIATVDSSIALNGGDFTISFWARRTTSGKDTYVLSQGETQTNDGLHLGFRGDDTFTFGFWGNDLDTDASYTSTEWHHWAVTYDRDSGDRVIYRDGAEVARDQAREKYGGTGPLRFGVLVDTSGYFEGYLDEIRVWNQVRTQDAIQANMTESLEGTEEGIQAYWPVEQGDAQALTDPSDEEGVRYAEFEGGAFRSELTAPLEVCARTGTEGNYKLSGIRYGAETTFEVTPSRGRRTFKPAFKEITLSSGNPVQNEVGFDDVSSFTVKGRVQVAGTQEGCPVQDLRIALDGEPKGKTDADGAYAIAAQAGVHTVSPQPQSARTFQVSEREVTVQKDTVGVDFLETTRRTLLGTAGGGSCGIDIGRLVVQLQAVNGCYARTDTISSGSYEMANLPPLKYNLSVEDVVDVPDDLAKSDIIGYFKNSFGTKRLDLTAKDDTLDVIYRAPLAVSIEGLPGPSSQCSNGIQVEDESLPNVPLISSQDETAIPFEVRVAEDYGQSGRCPVDTGTVRIYDEWAGKGDEATELSLTEGTVSDTTVVQEPTFTARTVNGTSRTYQKKISAVAEVGGRTATNNEWGLITGRRTRDGTDFVTTNTGPIPLGIVRDPPGDASSAFVEEGSSFCSSWSTDTQIEIGTEATVGATAGVELYKGLGVISKTEVEVNAGVRMGLSVEAGFGRTAQVCATTVEGFSTSDDALFTGDQGDVFIGTGMNLLFTEMDVLQKESGKSCELERFTEIGYEPTGFTTAYTYSQFHIQNSLLPRISDLMDDARRRIAGGDQSAALRLQQLQTDSLQWQQHLAYNDSLKAKAETRKNRSFDAGAELSYSQTSEETETWRWNTAIGREISTFAEVEVEETGSGFFMKMEASREVQQAFSGEETETDTRTVGYTLSDDDIGDYFSVDVKDEPVYNTPVFELRAGRSSCPWEGPTERLDGAEVAGTVPRDSPILQVNGAPEKTDVDPSGQATFELTLTNDSQSSEPRQYKIKPVQSNNPDGARLVLNGGTFNGPIDYFLQPGENGSQKVTLGVQRGPHGYRYEDLQVIMYPPCERALWEDGAPLQRTDTLNVTVQFDAPCTDVDLFRPQQNWTVNAGDSSLETIFTDLRLKRPRELSQVGLQYRRSDQEGWSDALFVPQDTVRENGAALAGEEDSYEYGTDWESVTNLPDGTYELRAYSQCKGAEQRVYSAAAQGVKDTKRPQVLDTPEPADGVLAFGDDISVVFDEPIDCSSIRTPSADGAAPPTALLYTADGDTLGVDVRCNGERLVFRPTGEEGLDAYENATLTAEVRGTIDGGSTMGLTDAVGNPLATAAADSDVRTWSFDVRRRSFAWQNASTRSQVDFAEGGAFSETLSNGSSQDVVFDLESDVYGQVWGEHPWLRPGTTQGTVPGGETQTIPFTVSDTLGKGTYRDTVRANSAVGARALEVTAKVTCRAPFGTPTEGAAYTMNLTARLDVPSELGGSGVSADSLDRVAAFVGNELRGVAPLERVEVGVQEFYRAFLTVRSDRKLGETVTFRLWDGSQCQSFFAEETVPFRANDAVGTPAAPTTLTATEAAAQSVPLAEGWTWISVNTVSDDSNAVNTALSTLVPSDGDVVKGQADFSQYSADRGEWLGSLESLRPGRGYLVRMEEQGSLVLLGDSVAVDQELNLLEGWNWLGYLPQRPFPVDHALQDLTPAPSQGDVIKSQSAFAQYVNEKVGWLGSLETLRPGRGYFLSLSGASTLAYPASPPTQKQVTVELVAGKEDARTDAVSGAPARPDGPVLETRGPAEADGTPHAGTTPSSERSTPEPPSSTSEAMPTWSVDARGHEQSMTVVADVQVHGEAMADPQVRLGAFIGGDLRGVARPMKLPEREAYRAFLLVHGAAQEKGDVSFRIFNPKTGQVHRDVRILGGLPDVGRTTARMNLPTSVDFVPGRPRGSVGDPILVNAGELPDDFTPVRIQLKGNYPNPVTEQTTVRFALPDRHRVTIEMYDVLGRRIRRVVNAQKEAGWHEVTLDTQRLASGVYFYRMKAGSFRDSRKMVVVK